MRAIALVVALAACGGSAARPAPVAHVAPASEGVRIALATPVVGQRSTRTTTMRVDADTRLPDGSAQHVVVEEHAVEEVEVLAVANGAAQKVRVAYTAAERTRNFGDMRSREDKPVNGHTYVVWIEGETTHVTRDDGAALRSTEEAEVIDAWEDDLGRVDPLLVLVAAEPWTPGVRRTLSPAELAGVPFGDDEVQVESATIALAGTSAATATFELDVMMRGRDGETSMKLPAKVSLDLERSTGRVLSLTMTGTMSGVTDGVVLTGTVNATMRWEYR